MPADVQQRGAQQGDAQHPATAGKTHECCLGLAHAPTLAEPSTSFVAVDARRVVVRPLEAADALAPVGIRDGPSQPRAPPLPV